MFLSGLSECGICQCCSGKQESNLVLITAAAVPRESRSNLSMFLVFVMCCRCRGCLFIIAFVSTHSRHTFCFVFLGLACFLRVTVYHAVLSRSIADSVVHQVCHFHSGAIDLLPFSLQCCFPRWSFSLCFYVLQHSCYYHCDSRRSYNICIELSFW